MQSLSVRYRPKTFDDCVGQSATIKVLSQQIKQNQLKHAYLFCGSSGCGKAQPLSAKVLTKHGFVPMKEIQPGSLVVNGQGNETKVLSVFPQGSRDVYEIKLSDGTSFEVADNHINTVQWNNLAKGCFETFNLTTIELIALLSKIKNNKHPKYPLYIPITAINCWEDISALPIDPYLLGCLLGDGAISNKNLAFSSSDAFIIEKLNAILLRDFQLELHHVRNYDYSIHSIYPYRYKFLYKDKIFTSMSALIDNLVSEGYPKFDHSTILQICKNKAKTTLKKYPELINNLALLEDNNSKNTNKLKQILAKLNLNVTSDKKFIPKEYLFSSHATRIALLQGLMDTDGYISKATKSTFTDSMIGGHCSFTTTSKALADDVLFLARSLGYVCKCIKSNDNPTYVYSGIRKSCKISYSIYIEAEDTCDLFTLPRKLANVCQHRFKPRRQICDIIYKRRDECKCILVESTDHQYITDNFSVTHNTTIARIFANEVNDHIGVPIEIDAASNSGVDNVRELIKQAQERSLSSKYKIFIIDECHALSNAAWQAFLKCIEETPEYTIFIFCTTDPQKIPATIINRCMRFNFTRINSEMIKDRLDYICRHENIVDNENVTDYISKICKGQMRDGISYLEQVADYGNPITMNNAYAVLGRTNLTDMFLLMNAMMDGKEPEVFSLIETMYSDGINIPLFVDEFLRFTLDLTKYSLFGTITLTSIPKGFEGILKGTVNIDNPDKYFLYVAGKLLSLKNMLKTDPEPKSTTEVVLLEITRCQ